MTLREAVLGFGLLLTGCAKDPCEQARDHVQRGHDALLRVSSVGAISLCRQARAQMEHALTAQEQCDTDRFDEIEGLRTAIKENCLPLK